MNAQKKDLVRYILNGIVSICIIIIISAAFALVATDAKGFWSPVEVEVVEPECHTCGCVSQTKSITITASAL